MDASKVYLTQTDTTVGFLSVDDKKLAAIKQRPTSQKILQVVDSFATLNQKVRVPKAHRKRVRHSVQTTFIYPNGESYRVVDKESAHYPFVKKFQTLYSTSANLTGEKFDQTFAQAKADVIVEDKNKLFETKSSQIIKFSCNRIQKLR